MGRRAAGSVVIALGALGVSAGAYLSWRDGLTPRELPLQALFEAGTDASPDSYWVSLAAPLAVVGAAGVLAALVRSRLTSVLAWLLGVATVALWALMRAIAGTLDVGTQDTGLWLSVAGLVVLLIGIVVLGSPREDETSLSVFEGDPPQ